MSADRGVKRLYTATMDSPLGTLYLAATDVGLCSLEFSTTGEAWQDALGRRYPKAAMEAAPDRLTPVRHQLAAYFQGTLESFELTLDPLGTPFQRTVWETLTTIRMGHTWSYGDLAREVGSPRGFRAVGTANRCNPIAIIVPCHRVIGASGALTGYAGGLEAKRWLLEHERRIAGPLRLFQALIEQPVSG